MKVANLLNKEKLERKSHKKMWLFFVLIYLQVKRILLNEEHIFNRKVI